MKRFVLICFLSLSVSAARGSAQDGPTNAAVANALPTNAVGTNVVLTNNPLAALTNPPAPEFGEITTTSSNLVQPNSGQDGAPKIDCEKYLKQANDARLNKDFESAQKMLVDILESPDALTEFKRRALFELALNTQDQGQFVKAQQVFAQYLHVYADDPSVPEVLLRQGLLYRQMGANTLALSKFYAVMSTALKLQLNNIDYYKRLVLQAQTEIADTYYLDGSFDSAVDFYTRIIKGGSTNLNKELVEYKLIRSLAYLTNYSETAFRAESFIKSYTNTDDLAEVRFIYANTLKQMGRNQDSMRQVLMLLQSQQANLQKNPEVWAYWQRRAGNEIANQLYKEGDYLDALAIYLNLEPLDSSLAWQAPVLYQTGLIYEQLQQWPKATAAYQSILSRTNELTDAVATPMLRSLFDMAKWRKDYIGWMRRAEATNDFFALAVPPTNAPPVKSGANVLTQTQPPTEGSK